MDQALHAVVEASLLYARDNSTNSTLTNGTANNGTSSLNPNTASRPASFKAVGISLAVSSGLFIGVSFVFKKKGLLKSNAKYNESAGDGYGYLKNVWWWAGMILMILGEICNFVAYAFVDAILVTPLGALSVVITTLLSAYFLKERLSMVGKIGCFLCIVGSVVIVMNAPQESSAATVQEMQHYVIAPGFLSYAGVIISGCIFTAAWAGPRYGKKSMLVYITICSWIGGLSVVATQGLGAAIVTQIGGTPQFNQWFLYVLLVFVIATLVTEIMYLNKALNLYNAAMVTPTYYVYFTSTTIITSAILFQGFKGTVTSIVTVVLGFLTICSGVVLLQLSKSAKDVPDVAVFTGDLDQVRMIAEQEQPEFEPKADAIRGTAAIVRRFSEVRRDRERKEIERYVEESELEAINEDETIEWDGLRRRRTTIMSNKSGETHTPRATPRMTPRIHPPLGMSRFPDEDEPTNDPENRPGTGSSFRSSIMHRKSRTKSMLVPGQSRNLGGGTPNPQSPLHPVPLTDIILPVPQTDSTNIFSPALPRNESFQKKGANEHITIVDGTADGPSLQAPTPPPHARRQFSFNLFRKNSFLSTAEEANSSLNQAPSRSPMIRHRQRRNSPETEEERIGLVKGDGAMGKAPRDFEDDSEQDENLSSDDLSEKHLRNKESWNASSRDFGLQSVEQGTRRNLTPPRQAEARSRLESEEEMTEKLDAADEESQRAEIGDRSTESIYLELQTRKWEEGRKPRDQDGEVGPKPPPHGGADKGAYI